MPLRAVRAGTVSCREAEAGSLPPVLIIRQRNRSWIFARSTESDLHPPRRATMQDAGVAPLSSASLARYEMFGGRYRSDAAVERFMSACWCRSRGTTVERERRNSPGEDPIVTPSSVYSVQVIGRRSVSSTVPSRGLEVWVRRGRVARRLTGT